MIILYQSILFQHPLSGHIDVDLHHDSLSTLVVIVQYQNTGVGQEILDLSHFENFPDNRISAMAIICSKFYTSLL